MSDVFAHGLGDKVRDKVSGVTGVITSRAEHLYGCARYWVQPQEVKDGKPVEGSWYDEDSLDVVEVGVVQARRYRVVDAGPVEQPRLVRAGGPVSQSDSHTRQTTK